MTSINKEVAAAKAAKAVISALSATTRPSLTPLHHAYRIAVLHLSDENSLNQSRRNAGIALSTLIHSQPTPEKIEKAKTAIDAWIKELEAVKP
jgi:hypothetical protein